MTPKRARHITAKKFQTCWIAPLSIEELEAGLLSLGRDDLDAKAFWDENIYGFRQTVLVAIRETSDALLSSTMTLQWRIELENQLDALVGYIKLADSYIGRRCFSSDGLALEETPTSTKH